MDKEKNCYLRDSQADTYIEECFERKCWKYKNSEDVINQWREDKKMFSELAAITGIDFQHYSLHDKTHSISILHSIEMVLGHDRVEALEASDLWLLLEAAYCHDLGMAVTFDKLCEIWESDEFQEYIREKLAQKFLDQRKAAFFYLKLDAAVHNSDEKFPSSENFEDIEEEYDKILEKKSWAIVCERYIMFLYTDFIRSKHPELSQEHIMEYGIEDHRKIPYRMYVVVASVARLHGDNFIDLFREVNYQENGFGAEHMHPQFAAAMLRLGDLLDMDSNRFNVRMIEHIGNMPFESMLHYKKHKAITHLEYSENAIQAIARSDDFDVCKTTSKWFSWLDEEVKNLICSWNKIVPDSLYGCRLNRCELKIYYKGKEFDASKRTEFLADSDRVYDMLIGDNIYKSRLDFIREYLQNAIDATKMRLWLQIKGRQDLWEKYTKETITPYDIEYSLFKYFTIKVDASVDWNEKEIEIVFRDYGIGMEEECVRSLSVIANDNWKKRTAYAKEISDMPAWLRPTGGFGIGVQSAFMITDQVEFFTKTEQDTVGKRICMESNRKGGGVSIYDDNDNKGKEVGTEVRLRVRLMDFFREALKGGGSYAKDIKSEIYDSKKVPNNILSILENYIRYTAPYSLFPIEVRCDQEVSRKVGMEWRKEKDEVIMKPVTVLDDDTDKEWKVRYAMAEETAYVWDITQNALVIYRLRDRGKTETEHRCYYKGIYISEESIRRNDQDQISLIYYGNGVKDFLTINRDHFRQEKENIFREALKTYHYLYAKLLSTLTKDFLICNVSNAMALNVFVFYCLKLMELQENSYAQIRELLPANIDIVRPNRAIIEKYNDIKAHLQHCIYPVKEIDTEINKFIIQNALFNKEQLKIDEFVEDVRNNSKIFYIGSGNDRDKSFISADRVVKITNSFFDNKSSETLIEFPEDEMCYEIAQPERYFVAEEEICRILESYTMKDNFLNIKEESDFIMELVCAQKYSGEETTKISSGVNNVVTTICDAVRQVRHTELKSPIILGTATIKDDLINDLFISEVDKDLRVFSLDDNHLVKAGELNPGMRFLLIPFTESMWDQIDKEKLAYGDITKEKYDQITKRGNELTFLIEWVYAYQLSQPKMKRSKIRQRYEKLLDMLYGKHF